VTAAESPKRLDPQSRQWLRELSAGAPGREAAVARLYQLLVRIARSEANRRWQRLGVLGPELDDLAHQAASDALLSILDRLSDFRGDSRFTTWAYKFVMFEVSAKLARHFWQQPVARLAEADWDRLPAAFGVDPQAHSQARALVGAVREAVENDLTSYQRQVFVAIVLAGMPLDALAVELGTNRNALYKVMFDARRKLRSSLVARGYLEPESSEAPS
jgi:RNA polymerase sigma-70 factor (ECF subfamily)